MSSRCTCCPAINVPSVVGNSKEEFTIEDISRTAMNNLKSRISASQDAEEMVHCVRSNSELKQMISNIEHSMILEQFIINPSQFQHSTGVVKLDAELGKDESLGLVFGTNWEVVKVGVMWWR